MRIIAGKYRGRRIEMPKGVTIRPTQDRVREAVFNIIRTKLEGSNVLDLFAGSGAFGIESISRGASRVLFVDNHLKCTRAIERNLSDLGIPDAGRVWKEDSPEAIKKLAGRGRKFDIIFLDPPYYRELAKKTLIYINDYDILVRSGIVIAEYYKKDEIPEDLERIERFTKRAYGDTIISLFRHKGSG